MNKYTHNSLSNKNNSPGVSNKDAVTSTESRPIPDEEPTAPTHSTYASFSWLFYIKMYISRLTNDLYNAFLMYWYPDHVFLPAHIVNLLQVQSRLHAERDSHTVTYSSSREQGLLTCRLPMRNFFNAFTTYILSSEDDPGIQYTPNNDLDYLGIGSDREPMFVIVDSSCVSNPSSKELLIDNRFSSRETIMKKHYIMNVKPVDVPSTSRDLRNDLLYPAAQLKDSDSNDEIPLIDINLQSDNELLITDSDCDSDSIVISYLKNKDAFMEMEDVSENSLDVLIPSFPGSPRSFAGLSSDTSLLTNEDTNIKYKQAIEFLHHDNDFLIAAEMGDENMLRLLIAEGTNIHEMDHLGRNALHLAVCSGNRHAVALLLNVGVSPNVKDNVGMTPLSLCLMRRPSWRMATMLFNHGAVILPRIIPMDTGLFLQFVMMCEPTREEERILRLLVEKGALVNDPDAPGGRQALHFAAMSNNTRLITILLDLGADLFGLNHRKETPKDVAEIFNCKEAYALLAQIEELYGIDDSESSKIESNIGSYSSSD